MPISIIILTYNSSSYINDLLDSIFKILGESILKGQTEVIIFDNSSKDNTVDLVEKYKKNINIIRSEINLGYAKGINEASKVAKGELLVVINPDSRLEAFDKESIENSFKSDKKLAIAGLKIKDFNGQSEKNAGNFFNPLTLLLYSLGLENLAQLRFSPTKMTNVDFVSGGFVIFKKEHFDMLKGYDSDYFMYIEDMDICYRAKKLGLNVSFLPTGEISHKGQGSSDREFAITNIYKGLLTFYKKNRSGLEFIYVKSLLSIKAAIIIFLGSISGKRNLASIYLKALKAIS